MGYSPVKGRFHTRYSPVRRSPSVISKLITMLPLDLHVLSLSLAFILSQDQTLHSNKNFKLFVLSPGHYPSEFISLDSHLLFFKPFNILKNYLFLIF